MNSVPTVDAKKLTRRRWLWRTLGAGLATSTAVGIYTWQVEPHWVEVVEQPLPIQHLPASLAGKTIVQLSDIHVGPRVDDDYLRGAITIVNQLQPDMVVVTGDFMSYRDHGQIDGVCRLFSTLKQPPLGCYGALGNHDFGYGWQQAEVADTLTRKLGEVGLRILRNEVANIQGLQLLGVDDLWGTSYGGANALAKLTPKVAHLALCHNPDAQDQPEWQSYFGWTLAGHTHGGQCKPPFLPPPLLPVKNKRFTAGHFELGSGRHLYINRGLGHLMQVRFNVRPEITRFMLQAT